MLFEVLFVLDVVERTWETMLGAFESDEAIVNGQAEFHCITNIPVSSHPRSQAQKYARSTPHP